jgi:hypothetical protein
MSAERIARAQAVWLAVKAGTATEAQRAEHERFKAAMRRASLAGTR